MLDSRQLVHRAHPDRLAELLEQDASGTSVWRPEELADVLRHQLASVIMVDLNAESSSGGQQLCRLSEAEGLLLKSYSDLLRHPVPPLALLRKVKDYAKTASATPNGPLPPEVGRVLYYACLACALVRRNEYMSTLKEDELRSGFTWVLGLDWAEPMIKELCAQALKTRSPTPGSSSPSP